MKKILLRTIILSTIMAVLSVSISMAAVEPRAHDTFQKATVALTSSKIVMFSATTVVEAASIQVTSCTLQKKAGTVWVFSGALTPPSYIASNANTYGASVDYSSSISTGTYRIKAVFSADGETITSTSNEKTF